MCLNVRGHVRRVYTYVAVVMMVVMVHNVALKRTRSNVYRVIYVYIYRSRRNATRQEMRKRQRANETRLRVSGYTSFSYACQYFKSIPERILR